MAASDDKVYPGSIDSFRELRQLREGLAEPTTGEEMRDLLAAHIAENLAGLAYILDGIRYSARSK